MGFLIDSSVLIAGERQRIDLPGLMQRYGAEPMAISAITASELLHGVHRAQNTQRAEQRRAFVEYLLSILQVAPFDLEAARQHAAIWAALQTSGPLIGAHDLLIAATALSLGYGVITLNTNEFSRVPGLHVVAAASTS
jgi:tRNA(fMet)-specific endonuclease VapC